MKSATQDAGSIQRAWIEAARKATNAQPVNLHRIPPWLRQAVRAAAKRDKIELREWSRFSLDHLLLNTEKWRGLFDHFGTSKIARYGYEGPSFVTEPYASRDHIEQALAFADWIGCEVEIGMASWWYPGHTTRIEFFPKPPPAPRSGGG